MDATTYNESLARLGGAAGLIASVELDELDEQADELDKLVAESEADDDGNKLDDETRAELGSTLAGIRQLVRAARLFLEALPPELARSWQVGRAKGKG